MNYGSLAAFCNDQGIPFRQNAPLKEYTTFHIGGFCPILIEPRSQSEAVALFKEISRQHFPYYILGRGSNLLFPDNFFPAAVIHLGARFAQMKFLGNGLVQAEAGALFTDFSAFSAHYSLSGLEFAYGIPGTVGGAVYMNAGAYGGEVSHIFFSCSYWDPVDQKVKERFLNDMRFAYRHSFFTDLGGALLTATFSLSPGSSQEIWKTMENHMAARKQKQPLDYPSAGSVFKRPNGSYASLLIDQCGLKGYQIGGAKVSEKHAGFIINQGDATCTDVWNLISVVQKTVAEKTGYQLECELKQAEPVKGVGEWSF